MKYTLKTTTHYWNDLNDAMQYISNELSNPLAAAKLYQKVIAASRNLDMMPERGKFLGDYYSIKVAKYRVIYKIDKTKQQVTLIRVLYSRRNLKKLL